ncbi:MAG: hypothetical protein R8G34_13710 [Paracoccaceae bacterium]|nr:hypothetical protein [Paracoccaceae bacterium]
MHASVLTDELFVISDLHIGGEPGFQIFNSTDELVWLIDHLAQRAKSRKVSLLINGDIVDFLAEPMPTYFDAEGATDRLDRMFLRDKTFKPIMAALRRFAATPNRRLDLNLGNHDLELALPWVGSHFVEMIANGTDAARGRITLHTSGAGVTYRVGTARIYCAHGNEIDEWNLTDYEAIRQIGRDIMQGKPYVDWVPNAGTQLVIDAMNDVKRRYPFVDLLKPEQGAVVPFLVALKPALGAKLSHAPRVVGRRMYDTARRNFGFLGEDSVMPDAPQDHVSALAVSAHQAQSDAISKSLLADIDALYKKDSAPMDLISDEQEGRHLGVWSGIWRGISGGTTAEILREMLEKLKEDQSFNPKHKDQAFLEYDEMIGSASDIIVTGHTHQQRAIERDVGLGLYFNTGTWARLIQLDPATLDDQTRFQEIYDAFEAGTMDALEAVPDLIKRKNTVLSVVARGGVITAQLNSIDDPASRDPMQPVPNTQFKL